MNSYVGVNPLIIGKIRTHAAQLRKNLGHKIEQEDLEQMLFTKLMPAIEKFDEKQGNLFAFVNRILFLQVRNIQRSLFVDKRKVMMLETTYKEKRELTEDANQEIDESQQRNMLNLDLDADTKLLPPNLKRTYIILKKENSFAIKNKGKNASLSLKLVKAILNRTRIRSTKPGEVSMPQTKNISCIELLSTRELSKLNEEDLCFLAEKIKQTALWIKTLKEKLEEAMSTKYLSTVKRINSEQNQENESFGARLIEKKNFRIVVEVPKKVTWSQKGLSKIYEKLDKSIRSDLFKVTYAVDERKYSQLKPDVKATFEPYRTVSYGKTKVTIDRKGAE